MENLLKSSQEWFKKVPVVYAAHLRANLDKQNCEIVSMRKSLIEALTFDIDWSIEPIGSPLRVYFRTIANDRRSGIAFIHVRQTIVEHIAQEITHSFTNAKRYSVAILPYALENVPEFKAVGYLFEYTILNTHGKRFLHATSLS